MVIIIMIWLNASGGVGWPTLGTLVYVLGRLILRISDTISKIYLPSGSRLIYRSPYIWKYTGCVSIRLNKENIEQNFRNKNCYLKIGELLIFRYVSIRKFYIVLFLFNFINVTWLPTGYCSYKRFLKSWGKNMFYNLCL